MPVAQALHDPGMIQLSSNPCRLQESIPEIRPPGELWAHNSDRHVAVEGYVVGLYNRARRPLAQGALELVAVQRLSNWLFHHKRIASPSISTYRKSQDRPIHGKGRKRSREIVHPFISLHDYSGIIGVTSLCARSRHGCELVYSWARAGFRFVGSNIGARCREKWREAVLSLPNEDKVGNDSQDKDVKSLVDHHTHPLQIALAEKTHPEIGQVRGIDQPMRDEDDGADYKEKP